MLFHFNFSLRGFLNVEEEGTEVEKDGKTTKATFESIHFYLFPITVPGASGEFSKITVPKEATTAHVSVYLNANISSQVSDSNVLTVNPLEASILSAAVVIQTVI
jgi:hypothetical protein